MDNYFIMNNETGKIELHFDKSTYMDLSNNQKAEIKSNFLFSRAASAWVSRAKFPNTYRAEKIAESLGLENAGKEGERLSFAEQQARKAERAEARADRYETYSENAIARGKALQKPIDDMHGDIAFFTQPNLNTSAGRAFTNRRNKMWAAWERGYDEFKKSEYFTERAAAARQTAKGCKLQPIDFCERRIKECNHDIKILGNNLEHYKKILEKLENGETVKRSYWSDETVTIEEVNKWIENTMDRLDSAIDKASYYQDMIEQQGGLKFTAKDIKPGDKVQLKRGPVEVVSVGRVNFVGRSLKTGWTLEYQISEILEIIEKAAENRPILHNFEVGDTYDVKKYNWSTKADDIYKVEITKVTPDKVTVKVNNGRAKAVSVRKAYGDNNKYVIAINLGDDRSEWLYDKEKAAN